METGDSWRQSRGKSLYGLKKVEKYSLCPLGTLQCIVQTRNQCRKCDIRSPSQQKEEWLEGLEDPRSNHTQWRWMVDPCSKVGPSNNFVENGKLSIKNQKSSVGYPESNRRAELAVKTLKE